MIYRGKWAIRLSRHAEDQAWYRGITDDMIFSTVKNGKMVKFGKNRIKFVSKYKRGYVICIGEIKSNNFIKILTIEWGRA